MLEFQKIKKHYSAQEQEFPQFVLKEYLQYKILEIIFSSPFGHRLVFMGGTAIKIVYGIDRFSEDLDLDNIDLTKKEFGKLISIIQKELEKEGLTVEFRNTFQNVYHCYLKFPKILFANNLSPLKDEKIMIRIDSFRAGKAIGKIENKVITKADIFAEIRVYAPSVILAQKIEALFKRKRSKGRDIYDIVYLFSSASPDYKYLRKKLKVKNEQQLLEKMEKLFTKQELRDLARDVQPFLLNSEKVKQVEKFKLWIKTRKTKL